MTARKIDNVVLPYWSTLPAMLQVLRSMPKGRAEGTVITEAGPVEYNATPATADDFPGILVEYLHPSGHPLAFWLTGPAAVDYEAQAQALIKTTYRLPGVA